jgi:archaeosine synthase
MEEGSRLLHRIEAVQGPFRRSALQLGRDKYPLPILIDFDPGTNPSEGRVIHPPDSDLRITMIRGNGEEGPGVSFARESLRKLGFGSLPGAVDFNNISLMMKSDLENLEIPITAVPLSSLLLVDKLRLALFIGKLKDENPGHPPFYFPGSVGGDNLEILHYMGAEIFDTGRCCLDASRNTYYTWNRTMPLAEILRSTDPRALCPCPACCVISEMEPGDDNIVKPLAEHNILMIRRRIDLLLTEMSSGDLRRHVMSTLSGKPDWASLLRSTETDSWKGILDFARTWKERGSEAVTYRDDLRNPDFRLWEERITENYTPLPHKDIMLILPCSARKPYSRSRTHKRIRGLMAGFKRWTDRVQIVVATSPLGAVPMELELLYPPAYYDITVTGTWFPEEIRRIRDLTLSIFHKGSYRYVVDFHPQGGEFFDPNGSDLRGAEYHQIHSIEGDPDRNFIETMRDILRTPWDPPENRSDLLEILNCINFCLDSSIEPLSKMNLRRIRGRSFLSRGRDLLFEMKIGGPQPTISGGELAWENWKEQGTGRVVLIDDFIPRGTVFNQGIGEVVGKVRPGDIVIVGHDEHFRGVGRAILPGCIMGSGIPGPGVEMISHC